MQTNTQINEETIDRLLDDGSALDLNLACNSEACYVATSEYELVYFSRMSSNEPAESTST